MKINKLVFLLCFVIIVSVTSCTKKQNSESTEIAESQAVEKKEKNETPKASKKFPFYNNLYRYVDEKGKTVEKLEFYGSDLIFTTFGKEPKITYSYDSKTKVLSITEVKNNEISEYIYNSSSDSFALYENGKEDDEWILEKYKTFSDKDLEEYKQLKELLSE